MTSTDSVDVLIIGAGPAGSTAAYWLARQGHRVTVVERREFPRSKACGDVLSPRAVQQLVDMGLGDASDRWHRHMGLRLVGNDRQRELTWPAHPSQADHGVVARRRELDELLAAHAAAAGVTMLHGHDAIEPIVERGFVRGAVVRTALGGTLTVRAGYLIIADGANSGFGRLLGTFRTRGWPYATAIRSYWHSPRHDEAFIEASFDLTDRSDNVLPGYGWVAPVGDGTVNIGVGLLSTARDFRGTNVAHLLDDHVGNVAQRWGLQPEQPTGVVRIGRIPMGGSVRPTAGPTYLVVGDAAAVASPFTGLGVDTAMETGRMAADVLNEALADGSPTALQRYPRMLDDAYAEHNKLARLFDRLLGRPSVMRRMSNGVLRSQTLAELVLRISSGSLRPDHLGAPETVDRLARTVMKLAPDA
ncbi:MAG: geranylgeranyl reductase family protein [Ilumatobacteraceae bacterium]|nr:geranylgeranyl reductase family protein [Ilumatobacteraceae bacterium]